MLGKLLGMLTGLPEFFTGLLGWLNKKEDTAAARSTNAATATGALVQSDIAHTAAVKDVTLAMMSHPIFWIAWGLGVFPVLLYHAAIFLVSTFPHLWFDVTGIPAAHAILRVPDIELDFGKVVVGSVFMLTGGATIVSGLASAWIKRA